MTAERIGPNFGRTLAGKIWSNPLLSFPAGGRGHESREDWTKFCQDVRGQNLVQSSLLSLLTGNQAERIGPNFARTFAGKIWPNRICFHFLPVTKEMTAERIEPNFARTLAGKIWSYPLCCHSSPVTKQRGLDPILPGRSLAKFGPIVSAFISYR